MVGLSFVSGFFSPTTPALEPAITWLDIGAIFAAFPVTMLVGFGVLSLLPGSKFVWQPPSWDKNPFNFSHGEQFFHLGAFVTLSSGTAMVIRAIATMGKITPYTLAPISMGAGVWLGLWLLTAAYRRQSRHDT